MYSKLRYSGFNMENRCYRELMNAPLWNLSSFSVMWNLKSSELVCRPRSWPFQLSLMLCHILGRWDLLSDHYPLDSILRFLCITLLLQLERINALGFHLLFVLQTSVEPITWTLICMHFVVTTRQTVMELHKIPGASQQTRPGLIHLSVLQSPVSTFPIP